MSNLAAPESTSDSLWTERSARRPLPEVAVDAAAATDTAEEDTEVPNPTTNASESVPSSMPPSWPTPATSTAPATTERAVVREVPAGPLTVAVEHLRELLPTGGRLLEVRADEVRIELPHASGPMLLEVSLRSGVVDIRARGGVAAEMTWRVPELAAALQSAGVRLGSFEVQPTRKGHEAADDGRAGDRQKSDAPTPETHRNTSRRVGGIGASTTSTRR
jgi:hypothetical protein